jgi:hypothetical protein
MAGKGMGKAMGRLRAGLGGHWRLASSSSNLRLVEQG